MNLFAAFAVIVTKRRATSRRPPRHWSPESPAATGGFVYRGERFKLAW